MTTRKQRRPAHAHGRRPAAAQAPPRRSGSADAAVAALRAELRASERRYRSLIETAAAPIFLLSPELVVTETNPEAERLFGLGRRSMIGRDFCGLLGASAHDGFGRPHLERVLAGRPARGVEGRIRQPDGTERVLLWNATRLRGPTRRLLGAIAVAQDITEREKAEQALREREARMSSVISTAPDAIITIDAKGLIQSFSATAEKLFGYEAGEVIGRNVRILMPPPHRAQHDAYIARYLATGQKRIIGIGRQVEAQHKNGTVFPVELAVGEVKVGSTHVFTGFIRDITARAKLEQDLRQAHKMEAIGQLTGGLAHDFNNLLTVITGNLEMLEPGLRRAEDRELLKEAQEAADLGAKLAGRLLAFGRRQPLNPRPIELGTLAAGMMDLLRRTLGESIAIEPRLAKTRTVVVDPGQVENTLLNLAINARDAMPNGGNLIIETADADIDRDYAAAHGDVEPGAYALLAVSDTGVGMTEEVRQRAFEPFFTTKGPGAGSGLGLSMVYGFVKQSGGHVQIYSEVGRGTSVRVYLPVQEAESPQAHAGERGRPVGAAKGETVLVVEDDARVRRVSVRRLKQLGYRVIEAPDGPAALAALDRASAVHVLFTDLVMPGGMSGLELARAARAKRPDIAVLFTSGYADPAIVKGEMLTERAEWLGKPYAAGDLATRLRRLLDH
jgi:PAS domain S-box-containing protein